MEGQIFTPEGSAILNEIVVFFWIAAIAILLNLAIEWIFNVRDN